MPAVQRVQARLLTADSLVHLDTGAGVLAIDQSLVELARFRCRFDHFAAPKADAPMLRVARGGTEELRFELQGITGSFGRFDVQGDELRTRVIDSDEGALAVCRIAWQVLIARRGGVLMHASAVGFGDQAVLAVGESGAGKSTFASLAMAASGTLLSDEILAVFRDGTVRGTPFRSDLDAPGTPSSFSVAAVLTLRKGQDERVDSIPPRTLIQTALSQTFIPDGGELSRSEALVRLTSAFSSARTGQFTFRKNPTAGIFIREWLDASGV